MTKNRTKIIATVGPSCSDANVLSSMIESGVNCFRVNLSHGTQNEKKSYFDLIKSVSDASNKTRPAILADLAGPKVRIRNIDKSFKLSEGQIVTVSSAEKGDAIIPISKGLVFKNHDPDAKIMINDGKVCLEIIELLDESSFKCKTIVPGKIKSKKGVNFLGVTVNVPSLTSQDEVDLFLALENGADWVALSFTRTAIDFSLVKSKIKEHGYNTPVMAKIEKWEAVKNLDSIVQAFDGVMVARGDLGVELPLEQVPVIQKNIIKKAKLYGKPVVIATQMLDSMIENPVPTRAEVSDIANSILDGADALMVTGETAMGKFPSGVIDVLSDVINETEKTLKYYSRTIGKDTVDSIAGGISHAACTIAKDLDLKSIVTMTQSGGTARMVSSFRPAANVYAMTTLKTTFRALSIIWGVVPVVINKYSSADEMPEIAKQKLLEMKAINSDEKFIITGGVPVNVPGTTNYISIL